MRRILIGFAAVIGLIVAGLGAILVFPQITEQLIALTCSMTAPSENCQRRMVAMGHVWSRKGNLARAADWYARAANGGNVAGMFHLAWVYEESGARHLAEVVRDIHASNQNDWPVDFGNPAARLLDPDYQRAADLYR
jgi:TPR repeat protein